MEPVLPASYIYISSLVVLRIMYASVAGVRFLVFVFWVSYANQNQSFLPFMGVRSVLQPEGFSSSGGSR